MEKLSVGTCQYGGWDPAANKNAELVIGITVSEEVNPEDVVGIVRKLYGGLVSVKHSFPLKDGGIDFRIQILKPLRDMFDQRDLPDIDHRELRATLEVELNRSRMFKRGSGVTKKTLNAIKRQLEKANLALYEVQKIAASENLKHTLSDLEIMEIRNAILKKIEYYEKG